VFNILDKWGGEEDQCEPTMNEDEYEDECAKKVGYYACK
jgi:hypothetical protein